MYSRVKEHKFILKNMEHINNLVGCMSQLRNQSIPVYLRETDYQL